MSKFDNNIGNISLSKKEGITAFIVKSHDSDNGKKFKVDMNYPGTPVTEYHTSGQLLLFPRNDTRQIIYCSGPANSGKSTQAMLYATLYHKKYPKNEIIVVSPKKDDPAFKSIPKLYRLPTTSSHFIVDKPSLEEYKDSLIIFDDYEATEPEIKRAIINFINNICIQGRSLNISAFIISHIFSNYQETRTILAECHTLLFPIIGGTLWIRNYLKSNIGLTKDQIDRIFALKSRFVAYNKFPSWVLANQTFYLL